MIMPETVSSTNASHAVDSGSIRAMTSVLPPCPLCAEATEESGKTNRLIVMKKKHKPLDMQFFILSPAQRLLYVLDRAEEYHVAAVIACDPGKAFAVELIEIKTERAGQALSLLGKTGEEEAVRLHGIEIDVG